MKIVLLLMVSLLLSSCSSYKEYTGEIQVGDEYVDYEFGADKEIPRTIVIEIEKAITSKLERNERIDFIYTFHRQGTYVVNVILGVREEGFAGYSGRSFLASKSEKEWEFKYHGEWIE